MKTLPDTNAFFLYISHNIIGIMRKSLQQRPGLQTRVDESTHPSLGTGNPYSQDMRSLVMFISNQMNINDPNVAQMIGTLRANHVYPSQITISRWEELQDSLGHVRPCRRTGNNFSNRLIGPDLLYLALYRVVYPKATIAEINSFLYKVNLANPNFRFYSPSQICRAEATIGLTRKKGSTTAYQAYYPQNLRKRWNYWNLPFPLGIGGIHRSRIIDLDECGCFLETTANRNYGKSFISCRVREEGSYSKAEKWNLLLAICGEDGGGVIGPDSRRWVDTWLEGGTTVNKMLEFVRTILQDIGQGTPNNFYVFTMDNLNSHKNAAVIALIHLCGHGVVYRAPYWPVDGAIEFVFNTIQTLIRSRMYEIRTSNEMVNEIHRAIASIETFANYFIHVGFNA